MYMYVHIYMYVIELRFKNLNLCVWVGQQLTPVALEWTFTLSYHSVCEWIHLSQETIHTAYVGFLYWIFVTMVISVTMTIKLTNNY